MAKLPAPRLPSDRRQSALGILRDRLDKATLAHEQVGNVKDEFASLAKQGDQVNEDDLVNAASAIVAHGGDPRAVATMLAGAPTSGPALAQWVGQQLQQMNALHTKVGGMREQARDALLRGSISHFAQTIREAVPSMMAQQGQVQPQPSASPPNALGVSQ